MAPCAHRKSLSNLVSRDRDVLSKLTKRLNKQANKQTHRQTSGDVMHTDCSTSHDLFFARFQHFSCSFQLVVELDLYRWITRAGVERKKWCNRECGRRDKRVSGCATHSLTHSIHPVVAVSEATWCAHHHMRWRDLVWPTAKTAPLQSQSIFESSGKTESL